jgi:hypothetical protein
VVIARPVAAPKAALHYGKSAASVLEVAFRRVGKNRSESSLVAATLDDRPVTGVAGARISWKRLAMLLLLVLLSFAVVSDVDESERRGCVGQLNFDFTNPCNFISAIVQ